MGGIEDGRDRRWAGPPILGFDQEVKMRGIKRWAWRRNDAQVIAEPKKTIHLDAISRCAWSCKDAQVTRALRRIAYAFLKPSFLRAKPKAMRERRGRRLRGPGSYSSESLHDE
jgi:hypothetical protein